MMMYFYFRKNHSTQLCIKSSLLINRIAIKNHDKDTRIYN